MNWPKLLDYAVLSIFWTEAAIFLWLSWPRKRR